MYCENGHPIIGAVCVLERAGLPDERELDEFVQSARAFLAEAAAQQRGTALCEDCGAASTALRLEQIDDPDFEKTVHEFAADLKKPSAKRREEQLWKLRN